MSVHQAVARAAQVHPRQTAIAHDSREVSWREFADRVARRGQWLRAAGLQQGDRIGVIAANTPEHLELDMAALWAGLVLVPVNTRLSMAEQEQILLHADCRMLGWDRRHAPRAKALTARHPLMACELAPISEWNARGDALRDLAPLSFCPISPERIAAIFYTGGTTGMPKGVVLSHGALCWQGLNAMHEYGFTQTSVFLHTAPLFHLADFAATLGANAAGARHVFLPEFTASAVIDAVEHQGADTAILVPTMIPMVLDAARDRMPALRGLRRILYGAAPIQEPVLRRLCEALPDVQLFQVYGQTECGGACTVLRPEHHALDSGNASLLASAGRATTSFLLKIIDSDGSELPVGQVGEICIGGPGVMLEYWKEPGLTARTLNDGWVHTGDLGSLDADGFVTIVGRLKDMIISGGENIFAGEVESALLYHPDVQEVAVIGVPDAKWGESVHAIVVARPGRKPAIDELMAHCRERIAGYKCPRTLEIRDTPLPLSAVGKVRKVDLRQQWLETHSPVAH